jgi:DNA-binding MarR family transcriptional regulator
MSHKATLWAFKLEIPASQKLLAILLADWADPDGYAWPRQSVLAERAGVSMSTVTRSLRSLQQAGLLSVVHTRRRDGRQGSNCYRLNLGRN